MLIYTSISVRLKSPENTVVFHHNVFPELSRLEKEPGFAEALRPGEKWESSISAMADPWPTLGQGTRE